MKIILANKFFYPRGGDCVHTIHLKQLLERNGHTVAVFSMRYADNIVNEYSAYWPSEVNFGSKQPVKLLSAIVRPFGVSEVKKKWNKLISEFHPDVVHLHNIHSQLSPIIAKLSKDKNIPVVWTLHDHKLVCPAYLFMDYNGNLCKQCLITPNSVIKKKCIKGSTIASVLGYLEAFKWNKDVIQSFTNTFITPSHFLRENMILGGYESTKLFQLYNFVESVKFDTNIKSERKPEIIYLGRLSKEKGISTLCEAVINLKDVKLNVFGDGPLKNELINKYRGFQNISFLGYQTWDIIKNKLGSASFLVLPSECYENNPLTIIESFALGTPVLGANIGGIPELIEIDVNGMVFESRNVDNLQFMIRRMLHKEDWDYQVISRNASQKFSADRYYHELMKIYKSCELL